jgi:hypothetical protein
MITECLISVRRTVAFVRASVADLTDAEMVLQPTGAPNHPAWTLGHLIHSWDTLIRQLGGASRLAEDWECLFGYGSSPCDTCSSPYSSKVLLLGVLDEAAWQLETVLGDLTDAQLQEPLTDAEARTVFATKGDALLQVLVAHSAFHAGQLAAWRRAIGRASAAVFV